MDTLMLDFLETAKAKVETIQATLRHRQQTQDATFHLCLKALRDAIDLASEPAGREEVIEECAAVLDAKFSETKALAKRYEKDGQPNNASVEWRKCAIISGNAKAVRALKAPSP